VKRLKGASGEHETFKAWFKKKDLLHLGGAAKESRKKAVSQKRENEEISVVGNVSWGHPKEIFPNRWGRHKTEKTRREKKGLVLDCGEKSRYRKVAPVKGRVKRVLTVRKKTVTVLWGGEGVGTAFWMGEGRSGGGTGRQHRGKEASDAG